MKVKSNVALASFANDATANVVPLPAKPLPGVTAVPVTPLGTPMINVTVEPCAAPVTFTEPVTFR